MEYILSGCRYVCNSDGVPYIIEPINPEEDEYEDEYEDEEEDED